MWWNRDLDVSETHSYTDIYESSMSQTEYVESFEYGSPMEAQKALSVVEKS